MMRRVATALILISALLLAPVLAAAPGFAAEAPAAPAASGAAVSPLPGAALPVRPARPSLSGALTPQPAFTAAPGLAGTGLAALGLDSLGFGTADPGPACRSDCAARRYMCGQADESCAENWRQCVLACR